MYCKGITVVSCNSLDGARVISIGARNTNSSVTSRLFRFLQDMCFEHRTRMVSAIQYLGDLA